MSPCVSEPEQRVPQRQGDIAIAIAIAAGHARRVQLRHEELIDLEVEHRGRARGQIGAGLAASRPGSTVVVVVEDILEDVDIARVGVRRVGGR
jgi:hypothetical protein